MRLMTKLTVLLAALLAVPAAAQLALPGVSLPPAPSLPLPDLPTERVLGEVTGTVADARRLLDLRTERIERLLRRNREAIELDARGAPARRGELLLLDPSPAALAAARAAKALCNWPPHCGS